MDFSIPSDLAALQDRTRALIRERIMPMEHDRRQGPHGPEEALRHELQAIVREAGLLAPHVSAEWGGQGLSHVGKALLFEEAGYSLLGPLAFNISAPDEGNMHLLEVVATAAQKERWLRPLAAGAIRSCFCMTEPPPGAGSDPAALATTAVRDGDDYVIDGAKWFTTGAVGAGFAIVMARMSGGRTRPRDHVPGGHGPARHPGRAHDGQPGQQLSGRPCGGARSRGCGCRPTDVLGEVGQGFRYAQVRLAPARLTHCMRWLGAARRAQDIAVAYAAKREAFGKQARRARGRRLHAGRQRHGHPHQPG